MLNRPGNTPSPYLHIGIFGLGLIGGSLAKRIKQAYFRPKIFAYDPHSDAIAYAAAHQIIDEGTADLKRVPKDLDLAIVATPVPHIKETIEWISGHTEGDLTLTDVGSLKVPIGTPQLRSNHIYIPGHPMAGTEHTGVAASDAALLVGRNYVLCPVDDDRYTVLKSFIDQLGVTIVELTAQQHDELVTYSSHLPYLMAGLTALAAKNSAPDLLRSVVGPGFRDTTRVASMSPSWGVDIGLGNKDNLIAALESVKAAITTLETQLIAGDGKALKASFSETKSFRDSLLQ